MNQFYFRPDGAGFFGTTVADESEDDARARGTFAGVSRPAGSERWTATVYVGGERVLLATGDAHHASAQQLAQDAIGRERAAELAGLSIQRALRVT